MKMEASCKLGSGSATPCEDEYCSLMDVETPKYLGGEKELRELTPRIIVYFDVSNLIGLPKHQI